MSIREQYLLQQSATLFTLGGSHHPLGLKKVDSVLLSYEQADLNKYFCLVLPMHWYRAAETIEVNMLNQLNQFVIDLYHVFPK